MFRGRPGYTWDLFQIHTVTAGAETFFTDLCAVSENLALNDSVLLKIGNQLLPINAVSIGVMADDVELFFS